MNTPIDWPNRAVDCAQDIELIQAYAKVIHHLEVVPHLRAIEDKGETILSSEEMIVFASIYKPKFQKILKELISRYNLKIEKINAEASKEESSPDSSRERKESWVVVYSRRK